MSWPRISDSGHSLKTLRRARLSAWAAVSSSPPSPRAASGAVPGRFEYRLGTHGRAPGTGANTPAAVPSGLIGGVGREIRMQLSTKALRSFSRADRRDPDLPRRGAPATGEGD